MLTKKTKSGSLKGYGRLTSRSLSAQGVTEIRKKAEITTSGEALLVMTKKKSDALGGVTAFFYGRLTSRSLSAQGVTGERRFDGGKVVI